MYSWNDGAYLMHHGIKGQKWGIRRFQNEDGSLTEAGKKRYYSESRALSTKGVKYNEKHMQPVKRYADATAYNLKTDKKYQKLVDDYRKAHNVNNEHYLKERDKWFRQEGKYKGADYYEFKNISADDWFGSDDAKKQQKAEQELKNYIDAVAKEHPLYNKSFSQLKKQNYSDLTGNEIMIEKINAGQYAVNLIMSRIKNDVASEENEREREQQRRS